MRADILKTLDTDKDLTNVIVLTHNFDLVFLESFIVPRFNRVGYPTITVFVDGGCGHETWERQKHLVDGIGKRYRIVPIHMEKGFRFHPKAIFLSSKKKATLFIGSGNMTFGGWKESGEVWVEFSSEDPNRGAILTFRQFLKDVTELVHLGESVKSEIEEAFDPSSHEWAEKVELSTAVIGKCGKGPAIVERMMHFIGDKTVNQLDICTPYFDDKGNMVKQLAERSHAKNIRVFLQKNRCGLLDSAAATLPSTVSLKTVDFVNNEKNSRFLHAKIFAFHTPDNVIVFVGSANCSNAALLLPEKKGNAELVVMEEFTPDQYSTTFLDELILLEESPQLKESEEEHPAQVDSAYIEILTAKYESGFVYVAYRTYNDIIVDKANIDSRDENIICIGDGILSVRSPEPPANIFLVATKDGERIESKPLWIDSESDLRLSSYRRALVDKVATKVNTDDWNINTWADIIDLIYRDLKYNPRQSGIGRHIVPRAKSPEKKIEYTFEDVFSPEFGLHTGQRDGLPRNESERISGLRQLLLEHFGIGHRSTAVSDSEVESEEDASESNQEQQSKKKLQKDFDPSGKSKVLSATEVRRAERIIKQVIDTVAGKEYLLGRAPDLLGGDLVLIYLLLRKGLNEKWIDYALFLRLSHRVWLRLFFSTGEDQDDPIGWIEYRLRASGDPDLFKTQVSSIKLSAVLAAWALSIPEEIHTAEEAFFELACAESIDRLDWIWQVNKASELAEEIIRIMANTGDIDPDNDEEWNRVRLRWNEMIQRGYALKELRKRLFEASIDDFMERIDQDEITAGEMLWQGKRGFCVAIENCRRNYNIKDREETPTVAIYCLQGNEVRKSFKSGLLIPVKGLLELVDFADLDVPSGELNRSLSHFIEKCSDMILKKIIR